MPDTIQFLLYHLHYLLDGFEINRYCRKANLFTVEKIHQIVIVYIGFIINMHYNYVVHFKEQTICDRIIYGPFENLKDY